MRKQVLTVLLSLLLHKVIWSVVINRLLKHDLRGESYITSKARFTNHSVIIQPAIDRLCHYRCNSLRALKLREE